MDMFWSADDHNVESEPYSLLDYICVFVLPTIVTLMMVVVILRHVVPIAWFRLLRTIRPTGIHSLKECCTEVNLLGKGAYGRVYRGTFDNQAVAIKEIDKSKVKITNLELELLSQFHRHKNVISFVTFWEDVDFRFLLIQI